MKYSEVQAAIFLCRPNRFIAEVELEGQLERVHVKNTGRCQEILLPGVQVYLERGRGTQRKTSWSLIAAQKGERLINIDSQAPNKVVQEALSSGTLALKNGCFVLNQGSDDPLRKIRPETSFGHSRFDFYYESGKQHGYIEVKGVTLEAAEVMRFPDAPTMRGARHMEELILAQGEGFVCYVLFIIQMSGGRYFTSNDATDPAFGTALRQAARQGVKPLAFNCQVGVDYLELAGSLPISL